MHQFMNFTQTFLFLCIKISKYLERKIDVQKFYSSMQYLIFPTHYAISVLLLIDVSNVFGLRKTHEKLYAHFCGHTTYRLGAVGLSQIQPAQ